MADPYSYVAPARVKAFLCPLGQIKKHIFAHYAARLQSVNEVRLGDITPDRRPEKCKNTFATFYSFILFFHLIGFIICGGL